MGLLRSLLEQCKKPTGRLGRWLARGMNVGHAPLTKWGFGQVEVGEDVIALDIGCGGGRTLQRLATMARSGRVVGIDWSEDALAVARRTNRKLILAGQVQVLQGLVSSMPFADATFDLVTAVETHYFWPCLSDDLQEVNRVMKPGGRLLLIAGVYKTPKFDRRNRRVVNAIGMTYLSPREFEELLLGAGYEAVRVLEQRKRGWVCAIGERAVSGG